MAEECSKSPMTSKIIKTDEGDSAGKQRSSRSGRTPHYLRAPAGSCHEHCKYGGLQTFKTKPRNPIRAKTTRKLPDELLLAEDVVVPGLAGQPTIKLEILSNLECQTSDIANVGKQGPAPDHAGVKFNAKGKKKSEAELKSSRSPKTHFSYLRKKVKPGMASSRTKPFSPGASAMFSSETYSRLMKTKMEPLEAQPMPLPDSSGDPSHGKDNNITTSRDPRTSKVAAKNRSVSSTTSNSLEFSSGSPPSMRPRKGIAGKVMYPLKNQNKNRNSTKNAEVVQITKEVAVQEKTLYVIDEESEHIPSECTSMTTNFLGNDQNGSAVKMSPDQSSLLPQHLFLPKYPSPKSQEEFHEPSDCTDNEGEGCSDSGHGVSDSLVQAGTSQRPTQDRTNSVKIETRKAVNLSLRKGKVAVGTQAESSSPKRLKIRRGRTFGENQNLKADARRRTFKRREEIEGGKNSSMTSSIKVTLKHQDVREKKEGRRLFNNMIEETASKLVKTQESKVKALVGAFETVISLQETKYLVQ